MISRRILPVGSAINFVAMISRCQFSANWVRGLSSRKQHRKADEIEARQRVVGAPGELVGGRHRSGGDPAVSLPRSRSSSSQDCRSLAMKVSMTSSSAAVNGGGLGRLCHTGLFLDVLQRIDQHLGGAQIGPGRFVDQLLGDRAW